MLRFIHAADLHLDSPMTGLERYEGAPVAALRGATRAALANLVELAQQVEAAFVLVAGDLYDGDWRDYNTGLRLVHEMSRLRQSGTRVLLVAGNHDAQNTMTRVLPLPAAVTVFGSSAPATVRWDDLGVAVHGQSYATRAVTANLAAAFPPPLPGYLNIGLLHTCVDGRPGHDNYAPSRLAELQARGYPYWALGHIHTPEVLARDPWVVYAGNTQGRHGRELGPRGCYVVEAEADRIVSVQFRPLDVARWVCCSVDATGAAEAAEIVERAVTAVCHQLPLVQGRLLVARVAIAGAARAQAEWVRTPERWLNQIRARVLDLGQGQVWVEQVHCAVRTPLDLDAAARRDDALGMLLRRLHGGSAAPSELRLLIPELEELQRRLPAELGDVAALLDAAGAAPGQAVEDACQVILGRLAAAGGTP
jgi:DNA repair exonuclease SbcCD nuclease subunit